MVIEQVMVDNDLGCKFSDIRYLTAFYATPTKLKQRRIIKFNMLTGDGIVMTDELYPEDEKGRVKITVFDGMDKMPNIFNLYSKAYAYVPEAKMACPEHGEFVGYKIAMLKNRQAVMVKLVIPVNARRTSPFFDNMCRCDWAKVVSITSLDGKINYRKCRSMYAETKCKYKVGKTVKADYLDEDRRNVMTHGIHFFMTEEEAREFMNLIRKIN